MKKTAPPIVVPTPEPPAPPKRVELAWVQFCTPAWPQRTAFLGTPLIQAGEGEFVATRLFLGEFFGAAVVFIENKTVQPARVPLSNVAAFGVKG